MKAIFSLLCLLMGMQCYAQKGVEFKTISWETAASLAAKENKLVFIDCYTTWCGPCKWMDQFVFPLDSVGAFCNSHFVNVKSDMEKGEGIALKDKYQVKSYPTYLFLNSKGEVVHRTGSRMDAAAFMTQARQAVSPELSFVGLQKRYNAGERNTQLLFLYAVALKKTDPKLSEKVAAELNAGITTTELSSQLGWEVIKNFVKQETDQLGRFFLQHESNFIALAGKEAVKELKQRLNMIAMFAWIKEKNDTAFFKRLTWFTQNEDSTHRQTGAMLETVFYLETGDVPAIVRSSNSALLHQLQNSPTELSFLAGKIKNKANGNSQILQQAYLLAKKAVEISPSQYSYQSMLAEVCLLQRNKTEGLAAATTALALSAKYTAKVQESAKNTLDKIKQL